MKEAGHSGSLIKKGNLELGKRFSKDEDLNSIPNVHVKKLGMMVDACNPGTGEAETGGSLGLLGQPVQTCERQTGERSGLKRQGHMWNEVDL